MSRVTSILSSPCFSVWFSKYITAMDGLPEAATGGGLAFPKIFQRRTPAAIKARSPSAGTMSLRTLNVTVISLVVTPFLFGIIFSVVGRPSSIPARSARKVSAL